MLLYAVTQSVTVTVLLHTVTQLLHTVTQLWMDTQLQHTITVPRSLHSGVQVHNLTSLP